MSKKYDETPLDGLFIESCKTTDYNPDDHFRGVTKMIAVWQG